MTEIQKERIWLFIVEKLVPLSIPVLMALSGYVWGRLGDHEVRLVKIETSRFTLEQGWDIREKVQALELQVQKNALREPPVWFITRVDRLEDQIEKLREEVKGR